MQIKFSEAFSFQFADDHSLGELQKNELQWLTNSMIKRTKGTGTLINDIDNVTSANQYL